LSDPVIKYVAIKNGDRLYQGEILGEMIQVRQSAKTIGGDKPPQLDEIVHPFAIVMTQDCDLEQDFNIRKNNVEGQSLLANVLFCEAMATADLKARVPPGKDIWKRVIQNKDERYQCIESIPPDQDLVGAGIPSLGCDFKRYFTAPAEEVYLRIELGQISRRSRLVTPYAEHLLSRFCFFQSRVPLPEDHNVPLST
jgi:hypothetical protein